MIERVARRSSPGDRCGRSSRSTRPIVRRARWPNGLSRKGIEASPRIEAHRGGLAGRRVRGAGRSRKRAGYVRFPAGFRAAPATLGAVSWVLTILGIVVLIVLHELGHFTVAEGRGHARGALLAVLPARRCFACAGVRPSTRSARSRWRLREDHRHEPGRARGPPPRRPRRAYYTQAPWKRIAVILAGPAVNILIAFLLFWAVLFSGSISGAITLGNLDPSVQTLVATPLCWPCRTMRRRPACCAWAITSSRSTAGRRRWPREHDRSPPVRRPPDRGAAPRRPSG